MKVSKKSKKDIQKLREGGKILASALKAAEKKALEAINKKVSTQEINDVVEEAIREGGAEPAFLNYPVDENNVFPGAACVSINDEIVHGVPNEKRFIAEGDLLKVDVGVKFKKRFTDAAITIPIGKISPLAQKLMDATKRSLEIGMEQIYPGSTLGNFGNAVDKYALKSGFSTVKRLVGHGVGFAVHEPPQIPNYGAPGEGLKMEEGMVFALEPMLNEKGEDIELAIDGMTYRTVDGGLSAHFEHTITVTKDGCEILTK